MKRFISSLATSAMLLGGLLSAVPAAALTVSPPLLEINMERGETTQDVIKVYNETPEKITYFLSAKNFTSESETGTPVFSGAEDEFGLATWVHFPEATVTLESGERKLVIFSVDIPKNADPGGHYGAIFMERRGEQVSGATGATVSSKTGALLLVRVAGSVRESGGAIEFGLTSGKTTLTHLPANLFFRFKNDGTIHLRPEGSILVKNIWGSVVAQLPVNAERGNVLPGATRRFETVWSKADLPAGASEWQKQWQNSAFGFYTANLVLGYGSTGSATVASYRFTVFPWQVFFFWLVIIVAVAVLFRRLVAEYNKYVISKYTASKKK